MIEGSDCRSSSVASSPDGLRNTVQPTSTFAIVRYRVGDHLTLNAGYDDRRNVILYREFENPPLSQGGEPSPGGAYLRDGYRSVVASR